MIRSCFLILLGCTLGAALTFGQNKLAPEEPVIELPPFVITKTLDGKKWRYAKIEGYEILSQCSTSETREIVAALWRGRELMLPPSFWPEFSVPMTVVLFDQEPERGTDLWSFGSDQASHEQGSHWTNLIKRTLPERESFSLNLWRSSFNYSSTFRFHTKTLLDRRTPEAPRWLKAGLFGVFGVYREGTRWWPERPITKTLQAWWFSKEESRQAKAVYERIFNRTQLSQIGKYRGIKNETLRAFIPSLKSLLEEEPPKDDVTAIARWASANALFVRWGIHGPKTDAFWKFAERACTEAVTETLFKEFFDMNYQEVRLEMSYYLPIALEEQSVRDFYIQFPPPKFKLRDATPLEIARLRGEWERLEGVTLEKTVPSLAAIYREKSERTFMQVYTKGERDPQLLASIGLLYSDLGEPEKARPFLENAARARVDGPEVYFQFARILWNEFMAKRTDLRAPHTIDQVSELLRIAESQQPALAENYDFLAHVVTGRGTRTEDETEALKRGRKHFPKDTALLAVVAAALAFPEHPSGVSKSIDATATP